MPADVLLVSLGGTAGLREADAELAASLRRAGAEVAEVHAARVREWRTLRADRAGMGARRARGGRAGIAAHRPRAVLYSSTTAALLAPAPGAIRFDAPAAGNRPGRHGIWQRPVERRRLAAARLLVPWSEGGLAEAPRAARRGGRRPGARSRRAARRPRSATSRRSPTAPTRRRRASTGS